jgi:hypothetical protein
MVAGLAVAPEVMRHRVSSGGWHAALQPYPWLTAAALTLAALYALLAEGTAVATARNAFPAAERAQLALLTAPVAGICAIAVAVTYRGGPAVDAAAIADAIALAGIAAITARTGSAGRFAVVCGVTGFVLAPAAGAMTALTAPTQSTAETGGAVLAAALCGAGLALLPKRPHPRALTAVGLVLAAAGLATLDLAASPARGRPGRGAGGPGPAAGRPGGWLPSCGGGAAARAYRRHHGARGARRAGDGGGALDADRGGPRWSGCPGAGLHRRAPDRYQTRSGPEPGPGIAPGAAPGKVAGGAPVPRTGATLDHG